MAGGQFFAQFGSGSNLYAVGGLNYLGTWNASTNTPTIASGVGSTGDYYVVSVAGTTNIDGISDWDIGDWIIFNGTAWQKIDNSDQVTSVNGLQGAVSIGLDSVLAQNNTTGLNDISVNSGQSIIFNNNTFTGTLQEGTYTGNQVYTLPDATGTIALTSDPSGAIYLNDLADVTTGLPVPTSIVDDGRLLYYSSTQSKWITKEEITFATIVLDAKKDTAGTIPKGTPVYLAGFDSDVITIEEADASDPNKMNVIGVSVEPINDTDAEKHILKFGKLTGLDTTGTPYGEVWNEGDILWVASGGGFTKTRPTGNTTIQRIAQVLRVDATGGQLEIFNTWRSAGLPNLAQNKTWVGDASGYPVETDISTFDQNLSQVLAVGNTTGGNNIVVSANQSIQSANVTQTNRFAISFFDGGGSADTLVIQRDSAGEGGSIVLNESALISRRFDNLGNEMYTQLTSLGWQVGSDTATDYVFGGNISLKIRRTFDANFNPTTLTANRTYTFQDASGTIAFLSDIPTNAGDTLYVTDGTLTGNRLVTQNGFDLVFLDSNGGTIRFDDSNAQLLIEGTIIGTTPKLVAKGEVSFGTIRVNDQYASQILTYDQVGTGGKLNLLQASSSSTNTQTFQDASGTIALLSDIPSTPTLSTVLSVGNNSGANDIIMDTLTGTRIIRSNNATANNRIALSFIPSLIDAFTIRRIGNVGTGELRITSAAQLNYINTSGQFKTIISADTNGVTLGGQTTSPLTFRISDSYTISLADNSGSNNGSLLIPMPILTTNRTQTFQDASGTIALLSDIPSTPTLNAVLGAGNTTSGRDIRISDGDWIETDNATADRRMIIRSINGGANPDTISITRRVSGSPIPTFSQPSAQITISDDIQFGVFENNGYSRMFFQSNGDILFTSANPTKNLTINDSYQFRLQLGGSFCNLNASGNATLTFPTGTGTIALTSDYQTGQTYTPTNVVTDRSFDANSTTLNEIADVLGTLITDLQSVNILS